MRAGQTKPGSDDRHLEVKLLSPADEPFLDLQTWRESNKTAIEVWRNWVEENGVLLKPLWMR